MKTKMCIKLSANCDKCRRKAMEVAAGADGVISVAIEGKFEDELVVVGYGVDAACLVGSIRKKACYATLETLEELNLDIPPPGDDKMIPPEANGDNKPENPAADAEDGTNHQRDPPHCCLCHCPSICCEHPRYEVYEVVYDSYGPTTGCTIM